MKIKQTDEHNKSEKRFKSNKAVEWWGTRSLRWEWLVKKVDFEPILGDFKWKREGVKEGRNDYDVHELPWVKRGECEGDWLTDWRNRQKADSMVKQNGMSDL